jgi:hypothetical protein
MRRGRAMLAGYGVDCTFEAAIDLEVFCEISRLADVSSFLELTKVLT